MESTDVQACAVCVGGDRAEAVSVIESSYHIICSFNTVMAHILV